MPPRLALMLSLAGCAARGLCPPTRTCGAAMWVDPSSGGTVEGHMVHSAMLDAVASQRSLGGAEALSVSPVGVWMRFDLTPLVGADGVERAVLALSPHPSWRPGDVDLRERYGPRIVVRSAAGIAAGAPVAVSQEVAAEVTLPAGARAPVRIDLTALVRQWVNGTAPAGTLTVESTGGTAVFLGNSARASSDRPRLEVVLR